MDARTPVAARAAASYAACLRGHALLAAVGLFCAIAATTSPTVYVRLLIDYTVPVTGAASFVLPAILAIIAIAAKPRRPLLALVRIVSDRGPSILATVVIIPLFLAAFTTFKLDVPDFNGFSLDPALAAIDEYVHGAEPWLLAHQIPAWLGRPIDILYGPAWFIIQLACLIVAVLTMDRAQLRRFLWTKFSVMLLLGTVLATLLPSAGPIFYQDFHDSSRFQGLKAGIESSPYLLNTALYADYLLSCYNGAAGIGTGISAMPSIHVALATVIAWQLTSYGRLWAILGWSYAAFILFGSVYTGWHYAIDGYVSLIVVSAIWLWLGRRLDLPLVQAGGLLASIRASQSSGSSAGFLRTM